MLIIKQLITTICCLFVQRTYCWQTNRVINDFTISACTDLPFLPMPVSIQCNITNSNADHKIKVCNKLQYRILVPVDQQKQQKQQQQQQYTHFYSLITHQHHHTFGCHEYSTIKQLQQSQSMIVIEDLKKVKQQHIQQKEKQLGVYQISAHIQHPQLDHNYETTQEQGYELQITTQFANISAKYYVGFVHALQKFYQSLNCTQLMKNHQQYNTNSQYHSKYDDNKTCTISYTPIKIIDKPLYPYRSIMIDTSRHFLPIEDIRKTIDALMYNGMSVLHWHIVDEDSFPLQLTSSTSDNQYTINNNKFYKYGAFSQEQYYTKASVIELVKYARVRGVRIVPEIDTPGHTGCWGFVPQMQDIACRANDTYRGVLDITLQKTYKVVKSILRQILEIFPDRMIHLGGDQVALDYKNCMKNLSDFLRLESVQNKSQILQQQYRIKQRQILKELDPERIAIYWMDKLEQQIILPVYQQDVIQWWGQKSNVFPKTALKNRIIVSNRNDYYIDTGSGNRVGKMYHYGKHFTWLDLYKSMDILQNYRKTLLIPSQRTPQNYILGVQPTLWSEVSNRYTHHIKLWARCSAVAERLWRQQALNPKPNFLFRLTHQERLMNFRGIATAPATCQQCESHPQFC